MGYVQLLGIKAGFLYLDLWGITVGILSYLCVGFLIFFLLIKHKLNQRGIIRIVMISACGHFIGGMLAYWYAIHIGADSDFYFQQATLNPGGWYGYFFAEKVIEYIKLYLGGDSFLAQFMIFSSIGFLTSVMLLLAFKVLLDRVFDQRQQQLLRPSMIYFPAAVLLLWPSYFFWSAQLVKDSLSFFAISTLFYMVGNNRRSMLDVIMFLIAAFLGYMSRPYLMVAVTASACVYFLIKSRASLFLKIFVITALVVVILMSVSYESSYMWGKSNSFNSAMQYGITQQKYMNIGSSFSMPTHNPHFLIFFLPYLIAGNLFLPLFYSGATSAMGMLGSIENLFLILMLIDFFKGRFALRMLTKKTPILWYFIIYFVFGMATLSIVNTNIGLAMREKMMYVPPLLVIMMLSYVYRKIMYLQLAEDRYAEPPLLAIAGK